MRYSIIKKFSGTNIIKIFEKIRQDSGGNAVLLGYEEKEIDGGRKYYEVIVGIPSSPVGIEERTTSGSSKKSSRWEGVEGLGKVGSAVKTRKGVQGVSRNEEKVVGSIEIGGAEIGEIKGKHVPAEQTTNSNLKIIYGFGEILNQIEDIKRELYGIKEQFRFLYRQGLSSSEIRLPPSYLFMFKRLLGRGVDRNLALSVVEDIADMEMEADEKALSLVLPKYLDFGNPLSDVIDGKKRKFIVLVGPTGVGKTTTAAKISAMYMIRGGRNVALLGTDRYRIGSVEQIRKYAEIMGVPLFVASTPEEIRGVMPKLDSFDLVVVDTMGKSQYDIKNIRKISHLLDEMKKRGKDGGRRTRNFSVDVCLLISCSQREEEIINVIRGFSEIDIDYIIFTKVDETSYPGVIINIGAFIERPIAFITTGQSVPDDIMEATEIGVAKILFGLPPHSRYAFR